MLSVHPFQTANHYEDVQKETLQNEIRIRERREKTDYSRGSYRDRDYRERERYDERHYREREEYRGATDRFVQLAFLHLYFMKRNT